MRYDWTPEKLAEEAELVRRGQINWFLDDVFDKAKLEYVHGHPVTVRCERLECVYNRVPVVKQNEILEKFHEELDRLGWNATMFIVTDSPAYHQISVTLEARKC